MAQAIPLITAIGTTAAAGASYAEGKKASKQAKASQAEQAAANKSQFDAQSKDIAEEQREAGARRRISSLRSSKGRGTLFGGARQTLGG